MARRAATINQVAFTVFAAGFASYLFVLEPQPPHAYAGQQFGVRPKEYKLIFYLGIPAAILSWTFALYIFVVALSTRTARFLVAKLIADGTKYGVDSNAAH